VKRVYGIGGRRSTKTDTFDVCDTGTDWSALITLGLNIVWATSADDLSYGSNLIPAKIIP